MKWPRGKYNGKRIVGFDVQIKADITNWHWLPLVENQHGPIAIHWLCFYSWWDVNFSHRIDRDIERIKCEL